MLCARAALAAIIFGGASPAVAQRNPGIFSGPDLAKYFDSVWLPEYPYEARAKSWSGRGTFRAYVEANGKVSRVVVIKSTGYKAVDEAVVTAARRWRAKPGRKLEIDFPIAIIAPPGAPAGAF